MLSETSQRKINTVWYHLYVESEKQTRQNNNNNNNKKKKTDSYKEQTSSYQ